MTAIRRFPIICPNREQQSKNGLALALGPAQLLGVIIRMALLLVNVIWLTKGELARRDDCHIAGSAKDGS